ncbi:MAG TPA: TrkH family potassium uptake protein [Planctomycetota bacterium]
MRIALVLEVIGELLRLFALAFLAPLSLALYDGETEVAGHFAIALAATYLCGRLAGSSANSDGTSSFRRSEALSVVAGTWLAVGAFASIPYLFAGISPVDSFFESISGFTTTGATILTDFSAYGRAFYLWRSMTQWFGGMGVIALFVVVLPRLGIAGRQLFFAEASRAPSEAVSPQVRVAARRLWLLYTALTLLQVLLLFQVAGMKIYDAICHSMTTMATGGFSPNPESVGGYHNPAAEWIFVLFMLIGGTSFPLLWRALTRRPLALFRDGEFLFYIGVAAAGALGVALLQEGPVFLDRLRTGAFQSASLISSTGSASTDYNLWGDASRVVLVMVMLVGGCAGSASGGPKAVRILLVLKYLRREITSVLHPRAVIPLRYKGSAIPNKILRAVFTLVMLYLLLYVFIGLTVVLLGADMVTGFSAALACVGNIGPGFGPAGPMGNFAGFPTASKIVLTLGMWIGRLEVVTVLALLHPDVWRRLRWRE